MNHLKSLFRHSADFFNLETDFRADLTGEPPDPARKRIALLSGEERIPESDALLPNMASHLAGLDYDIVLPVHVPALNHIIDTLSLQSESRLIICAGYSPQKHDARIRFVTRHPFVSLLTIRTGETGVEPNVFCDAQRRLAAEIVENMLVFSCSVRDECHAFLTSREFPDHRILAMDWPSRSGPYLGNHDLMESGRAQPVVLRHWKSSITGLLQGENGEGEFRRQTRMYF